MKIVRTIDRNRYTIELLPDEVAEAYYEWQGKQDIEDVVSFAEAFSDEELEDYYGCTYFEIRENKEAIAVAMRKHIDKDSMSMSEARELAVREVIRSKTAVS